MPEVGELPTATIKRQMNDGSNPPATGEVVGTLLITLKEYSDGPTHDILHMPTGLRVCFADSREDAIRIAQVLWSRCCLAMREKEGKKVVAKCPPWVKDWLFTCRTAAAYITPPEGV